MTTNDATEVNAPLAALHNSHDQLASLLAPMSADDVTAGSYATEWSVAQTVSHIGSGAEIFGLYVSKVAEGSGAPDQSDFPAIWAVWDAKSPQDQAADGLTTDAAFLDLVDGLSEETRATWEIDMFGSTRGLANILRMRLGEHALHTWDIAVVSDPAATVASDAIEIIVDNLGEIAKFSAKPPTQPLSVAITTTKPARTFVLTADDAVALDAGADPSTATASLELPAEALVRLVYGRLDDDYAPSVTASGISLDELRAVFPGP